MLSEPINLAINPLKHQQVLMLRFVTHSAKKVAT